MTRKVDRWVEKQLYGQKNRQMGRKIDRRVEKKDKCVKYIQKSRKIDSCIEKQIEGQKNRQLYRKTDRRVEKEINMKKRQMCKIYIYRRVEK